MISFSCSVIVGMLFDKNQRRASPAPARHRKTIKTLMFSRLAFLYHFGRFVVLYDGDARLSIGFFKFFEIKNLPSGLQEAMRPFPPRWLYDLFSQPPAKQAISSAP